MFTGIVECIGRVTAAARRAEVLRLCVEVPLDLSGTRIGESFSISGVCLTVVRIERPSVEFDVSAETLERTTLGSVRPGAKVNVERALRLSDRLGGHLVTGHIDATGEVVGMVGTAQGVRLEVRAGSPCAPYLVEKGSICLDGVSLTLGECGADRFVVHLIPHTLKTTTLQYLRVGDRVNLEADIIAKYVERFLGRSGLAGARGHGVSRDLLEKSGFL
jgi:riboflavin synthase